MKSKNISPNQEIRALIANKLTLPLVVLESLKDGRKVNSRTINRAINALKDLIAYVDKKWITKE
jgi:hypothetical protein